MVHSSGAISTAIIAMVLKWFTFAMETIGAYIANRFSLLSYALHIRWWLVQAGDIERMPALQYLPSYLSTRSLGLSRHGW